MTENLKLKEILKYTSLQIVKQNAKVNVLIKWKKPLSGHVQLNTSPSFEMSILILVYLF